MAVDPLKVGLYTILRATRDSRDDLLNQIFILNWLASASLPVIRPPPLKPIRQTTDTVFAIRVDHHCLVFWCNLDSTKDGCEFGAIVGCFMVVKWLTKISAKVSLCL